jgi:hypothetical protein
MPDVNNLTLTRKIRSKLLRKVFNFFKCISKNFGNRFAICANGFPRFWKCISEILEMHFQFLEMDFEFLEMHFRDFGNAFPRFWKCIFNFWKWIFNFWKRIFNFWKCISKILEMDFQFGDEFQCISLNLSNEFLIKKLYNFNNFYIFIKNSWLFYGFCVEFLPQNIDD